MQCEAENCPNQADRGTKPLPLCLRKLCLLTQLLPEKADFIVVVFTQWHHLRIERLYR